MIEAEHHEFVASDGYGLAWQRWPSQARTVRAYVVILHGIQSHAGWYEHSSRRLAEAGHEICFLDRRGSGRNTGARGDAPHVDRLVHDVTQFLAETRHRRELESPASPVVLMSVSWGGKLAAACAARRPELVEALALLYPGIKARVRPGWWDRGRLKLAERLGIRERLVDIPLQDPALFTADPGWQQFIKDDPLTLRRLTVGFLLANRDLDRHSEANVTRIRCPLLMMLAGEDRIIDNEATRLLFGKIGSQSKRLVEYPAAQHTLEFESKRDEFIDDLLDWLGEIGTSS